MKLLFSQCLQGTQYLKILKKWELFREKEVGTDLACLTIFTLSAPTPKALTLILEGLVYLQLLFLFCFEVVRSSMAVLLVQ